MKYRRFHACVHLIYGAMESPCCYRKSRMRRNCVSLAPKLYGIMFGSHFNRTWRTASLGCSAFRAGRDSIGQKSRPLRGVVPAFAGMTTKGSARSWSAKRAPRFCPTHCHRSTRIVIPAIGAHRHPGQAKREPGPQKSKRFDLLRSRDDERRPSVMANEGHPLAYSRNSALAFERGRRRLDRACQ
jgi:hypothetical protein